jgi:hypothetical protein
VYGFSSCFFNRASSSAGFVSPSRATGAATTNANRQVIGFAFDPEACQGLEEKYAPERYRSFFGFRNSAQFNGGG